MRRQILIVIAFLLVVATLGLTTFGAVVRAKGRQELAAVLAAQEAAGLGSTFADLGEDAPPCDPHRQAQLRAWMKARDLSGIQNVRSLASWRILDATPPEAVLEGQEAFRAHGEGFVALVAEGPICVTSLGWMPDDPAAASFSDRIGSFIPNLLWVRAAQNWLSNEAVLRDDPRPALDAMQGLHDGMAASGCLIDSMVAIACDAMRDDAYLVLTQIGDLPPNRFAAWAREPARARRLVADGLRGERLRFGSPLAHDLVAGGSVAAHLDADPDYGVGDLPDRVLDWAFAPADCATYLRWIAHEERIARGQIERGDAAAPWAPEEALRPPFSLMVPNSWACETTARHGTWRHHLRRRAAVLLVAARERGEAPADLEEALAWIESADPGLAPLPDAVTMAYVRLAPDRFRLGVEHPEGDALERWKAPPAEHALVLRENEVEVSLR